MNYRIRCLREKMKIEELDGMIVTTPSNIQYLLGVKAEGTLLITDKENIFITDARYLDEVNSILTIDDEINICDIASIGENESILFFADCNKVGFEENNVSYANYEKYKVKYRIKEMCETNNLIERIRLIKEKEEIEKIRKACEITDSCFSHLKEFIKLGMKEKEIALEIEKYFLENGAEGKAFDTIVASGENSSKPHATPTDRRITKGDIIIIDMGAKYQGYSSDMTRTIFVGEPSEEIKEIYEFILACQKRTTNKIKDGAEAKEIAKYIEGEFNARNYSLIHALGHGVGIEVHERPLLSYKSNDILRQDMIVTNEPGIYITGNFGIRIEDTILVGKMTSEVLTKSSKEILVI